MPNWCSNTLRLEHDDPAEITRAVEGFKKGEFFQTLVPNPTGTWDYDWCVNNWGTKWDINDVYIDNADEPDSIEFAFSTAWAPPVEAFTTWAMSDGRVQFSLEYWEPGCGFVGVTTYDGEYLDTDDVDCGSDPARYKEIASDTWGYEEYEEPEPLTEWYKTGVEAKGLA